MTVSDLKLKIFRKIDSLEKSRLEEVYGLIMNYFNNQVDESEWEELSNEQKQGIINAIDEIDSGKGIPHKKVATKIRKKYSHA